MKTCSFCICFLLPFPFKFLKFKRPRLMWEKPNWLEDGLPGGAGVAWGTDRMPLIIIQLSLRFRPINACSSAMGSSTCSPTLRPSLMS